MIFVKIILEASYSIGGSAPSSRGDSGSSPDAYGDIALSYIFFY